MILLFDDILLLYIKNIKKAIVFRLLDKIQKICYDNNEISPAVWKRER